MRRGECSDACEVGCRSSSRLGLREGLREDVRGLFGRCFVVDDMMDVVGANQVCDGMSLMVCCVLLGLLLVPSVLCCGMRGGGGVDTLFAFPSRGYSLDSEKENLKADGRCCERVQWSVDGCPKDRSVYSVQMNMRPRDLQKDRCSSSRGLR